MADHRCDTCKQISGQLAISPEYELYCGHNNLCGHSRIIDRLETSLSSEREKNRVMREALKCLYEETADYIKINNLGDVHHNRSMQMAKDALSRAGL